MNRNLPLTENRRSSGTVKIITFANIFETAQEFGTDLRDDFVARGFTPEAIAQGDRFISLREVADGLSVAIQKTGCSDFHLLLASRQERNTTVSLLLRTCPTLRDLFHDVAKFMHNDAQSIHFDLDDSEHAERLILSLDNPGLTPEHHLICAEFFLAQAYQFIGASIGSLPPLERVYLAFAKDEHSGSISHVFHTDVTYESEIFGFDFVKGTLDRSLVYSNKSLHDDALKHLSAAGQQMEAPFNQGVRRVIHSQLVTQSLSIDRVARSFGCSKRTLQRWIKDECGVSYNTLVEEARFSLARQLLELSTMSITDIALAVGYVNPTNFTRGFKKVLGCSPREWKKKSQQRHGEVSQEA